jgi:hypothetical protein
MIYRGIEVEKIEFLDWDWVQTRMPYDLNTRFCWCIRSTGREFPRLAILDALSRDNFYSIEGYRVSREMFDTEIRRLKLEGLCE